MNLDKEVFLLLNGSDSVVMDNFALTETSHFAWALYVLIIVYLIIKSNNFKKTLFIFSLMGVLYLLSDTLVASFFQPAIARLRPTMDLTFIHLVDSVNNTTGGIHGMMSNQASKLLAFSIFLSLQFRSVQFLICSLFWTLLHSLILLYLGYYYPSDILVGWIWGGLMALSVYFIYLKIGPKLFDFHSHESEQCSKSGYFTADILFANLSFLLNLIGIIIFSFFKF